MHFTQFVVGGSMTELRDVFWGDGLKYNPQGTGGGVIMWSAANWGIKVNVRR